MWPADSVRLGGHEGSRYLGCPQHPRGMGWPLALECSIHGATLTDIFLGHATAPPGVCTAQVWRPHHPDHVCSHVATRGNVQTSLFPSCPSCTCADLNLHTKLMCLVHGHRLSLCSFLLQTLLLPKPFPEVPFTHGEMSLYPSLKS